MPSGNPANACVDRWHLLGSVDDRVEPLQASPVGDFAGEGERHETEQGA